MPDPATGITAGVGLLGAHQSSSASRRASRDAAAGEAAALAFEQERYDDWKAIYGPIQENLADYFSGVTADYYEVQGLEAFEMEKETTLKALEESLAQRGISDSGIAAALETGIEMEAIGERARIRTEAPAKAAEEKMRFLQVGLGSDPSQSLANTLSNQASAARSRASAAQQAAGEAVGSAISTTGTALADYYGESA